MSLGLKTPSKVESFKKKSTLRVIIKKPQRGLFYRNLIFTAEVLPLLLASSKETF